MGHFGCGSADCHCHTDFTQETWAGPRLSCPGGTIDVSRVGFSPRNWGIHMTVVASATNDVARVEVQAFAVSVSAWVSVDSSRRDDSRGRGVSVG